MEDDWRKAGLALIIIENHLLASNGSKAGRAVNHPRVCSIGCLELQMRLYP